MIASNFKEKLIFLVPILLITAILYIMIATSIYVSMSDWRSYKISLNFVGLRNYVELFSNPRFYAALRNNIIWIALFMIPTSFLGLLIAYIMVLTGKELIFRTVFLLPTAISMTVAGTLWVWMYASEGAINTLLKIFNLGFLTRPWISDPSTALYALIFVTIWQYLGFAVIIFEAAIKGIDPSLIEAAQIDGASSLRIFWDIVVPQVRHGFLVAVPLLALSALKIFDIVYVATRGGPGLATDVLGYFMWETAFWSRFMADGAAIATIIFAISLGIVIPYALIALRRWFG